MLEGTNAWGIIVGSDARRQKNLRFNKPELNLHVASTTLKSFKDSLLASIKWHVFNTSLPLFLLRYWWSVIIWVKMIEKRIKLCARERYHASKRRFQNDLLSELLGLTAARRLFRSSGEWKQASFRKWLSCRVFTSCVRNHKSVQSFKHEPTFVHRMLADPRVIWIRIFTISWPREE